MESVAEQIEYGIDICIHGRNLGTPGGADLMCGDCEAGFTSHHVCIVCDTKLWVQHGQWVVKCEPNPERTKLAELIYKTRNELRRDGRYDSQWRNMLTEIIQRDQWRLPRTIHEYNKEAVL